MEEARAMQVISVNVGKVRETEWKGKTFQHSDFQGDRRRESTGEVLAGMKPVMREAYDDLQVSWHRRQGRGSRETGL
jgi:hypothetical protein